MSGRPGPLIPRAGAALAIEIGGGQEDRRLAAEALHELPLRDPVNVALVLDEHLDGGLRIDRVYLRIEHLGQRIGGDEELDLAEVGRADAFLMPMDDVTSRIRYVTDLEGLVQAKKRWGVSVAALNYRLHKLRVVSDWQNRSLNIEMSSRGYRRSEPEGLAPETSALWPQIFTSLWRDRITRDQIAAELNVPATELETILHRLTGMNAGAGGAPVTLRSV